MNWVTFFLCYVIENGYFPPSLLHKEINSKFIKNKML